MRTLSKKEMEKLTTVRKGHRSRARAEMEVMEVGEVKLLTKEEWTRPTQAPYHTVRQIEKAMKRKYRCEPLLDKTGWVIERLE